MPATPSTPRELAVSPGERRSSFAWSLLVGLVAAALVLLIALAWITLANTSTTVNDVKNTQTNHAATLNRIDRVDAHLKTEINKLNSATATVDRILAEAGAVSSELLADQHAICATLHAAC